MRVFLNKEGREKIKKGIDISVGAISSTLGGAGCTSVIYSGGLVAITRDGVSVARSLVLEGDDNIGATIIRSSAEKQLEDCGDGTSAASIITQKILEYGFECIDKNVNVTELKKGIDMAVSAVSERLKSIADAVGDDNEKIKNIAKISANNDTEIGDLIADAFSQIGNDGDLFIEESKSFETSIRIEKGLKIHTGYISQHFCTVDSVEVELINPYILLYDGKIDKWAQMKPVLDKMMAAQKREILIVCDNMEGEALAALIVNKQRGVLNCVCVRAPYFGEKRKYYMQDIAELTGGVYISVEKGIKDFDISHCGTAEKILVTKDETTIISGLEDVDIVNRISSQIDGLIKHSKSEYETEMLKERKAKVKGKLAVISVGAQTETEMKEKKDRVDDAIKSVKSAIQEGVVPGGGIALFRCISILDNIKVDNNSQSLGVDVIRKSLSAPLKQILENSGIDDKDSILNKLNELGMDIGYNVKTGEIEDMIKSGIIDAAKVVRFSLTNAASIAGTILTAKSLIC